MLHVPQTPVLFAPATASQTMPLDGGFIARYLTIDIEATVNWAAPVTLFQDAFARAWRCNLFLANSNPVASFRGDVWRAYRQTVLNQGTDDTYAEIGAGAGNQTGRWTTTIPFADSRLPDPDATAYDLALANTPRLEINFDGPTAMTATAGAHALVSATVSATLSGVARPAGSPPTPRLLRRFKQYGSLGAVQVPAGSLGDSTLIRLDVDTLVRRVMVQTRENTSATRPRVDGLLTALGWSINGQTFGLIPERQLRQLGVDVLRAGLNPTGLYTYDFDTSDALNLAELLSLRGVSGIAGLNPRTAAAYANGLLLDYLEETIVVP